MPAVVSTATKGLLKNRRFLLLWANQVFTQIAFNLVTFSLLIWAYKLTGANIAVSLWLLASLIPSATLSILAGVIVDNVDRKRLMVMTNIIWAIMILSYITAEKSFAAILAITVIAQGIDEFFGPAQTATLPQLVSKDELLTANSLFSMSIYGAGVVGFVLAGPLLRFFGFPAPFILAAVLSLLGAIFTTRLPMMKSKKVSVPLKNILALQFWGEVRDGFTFCVRSPLVCGSMLFTALLLVGGTVAGTLGPGFMEQGLGIDAKDMSLVGGLPASLGLILGTILLRKASRKGWRNKKLVGTGLLIFGFGALALASVPIFRPQLIDYADRIANHITLPQTFERFPGISIITGAIIFVVGIAATFIVIPTATFMQKGTPNEMRGRIYGFLGTITAVLQGSITLAFGAAADVFTPPPMIAVVGFIALAMAIFKDKIIRFAIGCVKAACHPK